MSVRVHQEKTEWGNKKWRLGKGDRAGYMGIATTYHGLSGQAGSQLFLSRKHNLLNFRNTKCIPKSSDL